MSIRRVGTRLLLCTAVFGAPVLNAQVIPSKPEIMVLASPHLRGIGETEARINVAGVLRAIRPYAPDAVVVEWLHPSIDPSTTFNYPARGDGQTLARLWGLRLDRIVVRGDSLRRAIEMLGQGAALRSARAGLHRELGRVLYLAGDETNAAYQWYRARLDGVPDPDAERLVNGLLDGHEAVAWGFALAAEQKLDMIIPFDYQGPRAGSAVWGEMLRALRDTALTRAGLRRRDSVGYARAEAEFDSLRARFETSGDTSWLARYGRSPGVLDYATVWREIRDAFRGEPAETDGFARMRYYQSRPYVELRQRLDEDVTRSITFGGFGNRRADGSMARNIEMANFLEAGIAARRVSRVLVVVGAGHKWALEAILRERGYRIRPSSEFLPAQ